MPDPLRGDIWLADLDPVRGREQAGRRPVLIISSNIFNTGGSELTVVIPLTTRYKGLRSHVPVNPPEGNVRFPSYVKCEDIRSLSRERFIEHWGTVSPETLRAVGDRIRFLLEL